MTEIAECTPVEVPEEHFQETKLKNSNQKRKKFSLLGSKTKASSDVESTEEPKCDQNETAIDETASKRSGYIFGLFSKEKPASQKAESIPEIVEAEVEIETARKSGNYENSTLKDNAENKRFSLLKFMKRNQAVAKIEVSEKETDLNIETKVENADASCAESEIAIGRNSSEELAADAVISEKYSKRFSFFGKTKKSETEQSKEGIKKGWRTMTLGRPFKKSIKSEEVEEPVENSEAAPLNQENMPPQIEVQ